MATITAPMDKLMQLMLMQYRTSPNFIAHISVYAAEIQEVYSCLQQCLRERYYGQARGAQLDVVGEIVGASRTLEGVVVAGNFGYLAAAEALGMGRDDDPSLGGPLRSEKDEVVEDIKLEDDLFRNWIDARIIKNVTNCNVEDTISFFRLLLGKPELLVEVKNPAPATAEITLHTILDIYEAARVRSLAEHIKPAGVTFIVQDEQGVIETLPVKYSR